MTVFAATIRYYGENVKNFGQVSSGCLMDLLS